MTIFKFNRLYIMLTFLLGVAANTSIGRRKAVPVIFVQGTHYEVGFDVGRTFSSIIKNFIATFGKLRQFEKEYRTEAGRIAYDKTLANMKKRFPYYVKEIQGVADGASVPFHTLFLLHMDDLIETINDNHIPRNDTGGCSSIAFKNPQATMLGHTEDAFSETLNHFYIMSAHITPSPEDKDHGAVEERFASLCYAGSLPGYTMGYNENGLVFSINTLSPLVLKPGNTPRTFLARAMLRSKNFSEIESILRDEGLGVGNGFSVNMIWSNAWGGRQVYNVEVSPDLNKDSSQLNIQKYDNNETLVHCNKYQRTNITEVIGPLVDSSVARLNAIHSQPHPRNRKDIAQILSDTTDPVFKIFQERPDDIINTIAAGIFDVDKQTWSIYINQPKSSEPVAVLPITFTSLGY